MNPEAPCACGSGAAFAACCGPIIEQQTVVPTAEALMRSRYTAYTLAHREHLLRTWHPRTRPQTLSFDSAQRWLGLKIKYTEAGREDDDTGRVEFVARFKIAGRGHRLHEDSRFERLAGQWVYVDGVQKG